MGSYDQRTRDLIGDHNPWGEHGSRDEFNQNHRPDGTHQSNRWPPHDGAVPGSQRDVTLPTGTVLDRFGGERGRFLSPLAADGTPYHYRERAIFPDNAQAGYHVYVVADPGGLRGELADVAPALGQSGGGRQFTLTPDSNVEQLLAEGVLREVHVVPSDSPLLPDDFGRDAPGDALPGHLRPILDDGGIATPAGAALLDPSDTRTRRAAEAVAPISGHFVLDVHSDGTHAVVGGQRLSGDDLNALARGLGWNGTDPIILNACEAGRGPDGLAADLARASGATVIAPTDRSWSGENNTTPYSSSSDYVDANGRTYPRIPPDGGWNAFGPDGSMTPTGSNGLPIADPANTRAPESTSDNAGPATPDLDRGLIQSDFVPPRVDHPNDPVRIRVDDNAAANPAAQGDPLRALASDERLIGRPGLDPNTAYQVDGRGTYYTDHRGMITHADLVAPNTRDGANPDVDRPAPDTTYRVDVDGAEHRYTTDDQGYPPRYQEWVEPLTNNPDAPVQVPAPGQPPGGPLGPLGDREAFSDRTDLPPNTKFEVTGRGTFYTGDPDADGHGRVVAVEALSSPGGPRDRANPDLNNFHPNCQYVVGGDFVIQTNEHGIARESTDERTYGPSRRDTRSQWSQDIVGAVGGTGYDGGHIKPNQVTRPTPDAVGQFPQQTGENQGRGMPNNRDTWYGQDMRAARDQRAGTHTRWHDFQADGGPVPSQVHGRFVMVDSSGAPRIKLRRYDNV
ncbi:MAG: TNT domain-containing protein [Actinomycetota bacterium]|nr:TNT domain-containing protein [Actinomycetota bacterium]